MQQVVPRCALVDEASWTAHRIDLKAWTPAIDRILSQSGLAGARLSPYGRGSAVVVRAGKDVVVKVYYPTDGEDCAREASILKLAAGRLPVPVPSCIDTGHIDECPYLVMTHLDGEELGDVWETMTNMAKLDLVAVLGETARALHDLPLGDPPPPSEAWPPFLQRQIRTAAERQAKAGLAPFWVEQIDPFLDSRRADLEAAPPASILHTELMHDHLLVTRLGDGWRLSGLFDFADAMVGPPAYELPSVGLFVSCGDLALHRRFLTAYGFSPAALTPIFSERILAWTLCHRYANLPWFLLRMPVPKEERKLEDLARRWFACQDFC